MSKVKNRRKYLRYISKGTVTYKRSIHKNKSIFKEVTGRGQLQNLSKGGICLITKQRLAPKQLVSVAIPLTRQNLTVPTLGYIQWTKPLRGQARYAAGLSFLI
jgi:hypothetical protein